MGQNVTFLFQNVNVWCIAGLPYKTSQITDQIPVRTAVGAALLVPPAPVACRQDLSHTEGELKGKAYGIAFSVFSSFRGDGTKSLFTSSLGIYHMLRRGELLYLPEFCVVVLSNLCEDDVCIAQPLLTLSCPGPCLHFSTTVHCAVFFSRTHYSDRR